MQKGSRLNFKTESTPTKDPRMLSCAVDLQLSLPTGYLHCRISPCILEGTRSPGCSDQDTSDSVCCSCDLWSNGDIFRKPGRRGVIQTSAEADGRAFLLFPTKSNRDIQHDTLKQHSHDPSPHWACRRPTATLVILRLSPIRRGPTTQVISGNTAKVFCREHLLISKSCI